MKALVTGASGYVGSRLVSALLDDGCEVVATARSPRKLQEFDWASRVTCLGLDVLDAGSVQEAFDAEPSIDVVYYLVHALGEGDYESSDKKAARIFADASAAAGVSRVVYLGGFVPADGEMSPHLRSRADVGRILADSPVDAVLLQAAVIVGAGSTSFEIIRHLVDRLPVVPLPPFMRHHVQPIAVDDVLHYLVACADRQRVPAGTYDISGEEVTTYAGLARTYADVAGLRRVFLPLPFVPPLFAASVIGPLTPVPNALVSDLIRSLSVSMTTDDQKIRQLVPDPLGGLTGLKEAVVRAVSYSGRGVGVDGLGDPLGLAETDAEWAGDR